MTYGSVIYELAEELGVILKKRHLKVAVAESCTGGSLAATMTSIPGSSDWFEGGFITYSNAAKEQMIGVPCHTIKSHGAVSEQTAKAMAEGVIRHTDASVSVAITGIAGPMGGSDEKPVGTVWIAWAGDLQTTYSHCYHFEGNRPAVRHQAVQMALEGLKKRCDRVAHSTSSNKARYFFALYPEPKMAEAFLKQSEQLEKMATFKVSPLSKLHLTLVYLGAVPQDFLQEAMRVAAHIDIQPFEININQMGIWPRSNTLWLGSHNPSEALSMLVEKLKSSLIGVGFKPEKKLFKPHVTIARQCNVKEKTREVPPIVWSVDTFCLVKSTQREGGSHYEIIASWPLNHKTN